MKKGFYHLLVLFALQVGAQTVNIPNALFKAQLLEYSPVIDTNGDGEIQIAEAQVVTSLTLDHQISDTTGIEAFTNLTTLTMRHVTDPSVDLSALTNLETLDLFDGFFNTLNISGLVNLKNLNLSPGHLDALDLSGLTALEIVNCFGNGLDSITHTGLPNLIRLNAGTNQLTSFNTTGLPVIEWLILSRNEFTAIDVTELTTLKVLDLHESTLGTTTYDFSTLSQIEELNVSSCGLTSINVTGLTNLKILACANNELPTIDVTSLINLKTLDCHGNHLVDIDVTGLAGLEKLFIQANNIAALDVSTATALLELNCSENSLASLNTSPLTNLERLFCGGNAITQATLTIPTNLKQLSTDNMPMGTLDFSSHAGLLVISCRDNQLTALMLPSSGSLRSIECSNNQLTALNLDQQTSLIHAECSNNLFATLDFSHTNDDEYSYRHFANNPNLTTVNLKNGHSGVIPPFDIDATNCPNLIGICADEEELAAVQEQIWLTNPDVEVNPYCSFVPGGSYNTITGVFTTDLDINGCGANDETAVNVKVIITENGIDHAVFSNLDGQFFDYVQQGSFILTPQLENNAFTTSPASATLTFSANDTTQTQNFCLTPNGIYNDVEIAIIASDAARPGFDAHYRLVCENKGNQIYSGNVNLDFDDAVMDFVIATPAPSTQITNILSWNITNLHPFQKRYVDITMNINSPVETPAVNNGDVLNFAATAQLPGDEMPEDNTASLAQTVVGSFDPNDKTCTEGTSITPEMIGDYLHYLIRFQNSGTFFAENVVVTDIIDPDKLDIGTLQLTAASHPHQTRINGNKVEFIFEGINLPAEQDDEYGSQGYVAFKIKTRPTLVLNDIVQNTADIFFDFNAPITTNTTSTTVSLLSIGEVENTRVSVAPNPVSNMLTISARDNISSVQIFDIQGRLLQTVLEHDVSAIIDFSAKSNGIYFVKVTTENGVKIQKIIKE
jgi:hypothetical protein